MLNQFNVFFDTTDRDAKALKHIQHNYQKRLSKLKYVSYRRMDISLYVINTTQGERAEIDWNDRKMARINIAIDQSVFDSPATSEHIITIYQALCDSLMRVWKVNGWDSNDILQVLSAIKEEQYEVKVCHGKAIKSPDKTKAARVCCDLFPAYADYYLVVTDRKNKTEHRLKFLKGNPVVDIFFMIFRRFYWQDNEHFIVKDFREEIFYDFSIVDNSFTICYEPTLTDPEYLKNCVATLNFDVSDADRLKLILS